MKNYTRNIVNLLQEEEGVSAVEYAVLLTLFVVIAVAGMATVGVHPDSSVRP